MREHGLASRQDRLIDGVVGVEALIERTRPRLPTVRHAPGCLPPQALQDELVESVRQRGLGIDRVAMIRYGIPNIRMLFDNDERLLRQVKI